MYTALKEERLYVLYSDKENKSKDTVIWTSSKPLRHIPWGCVRNLFDSGFLFSYNKEVDMETEQFEGTVEI